MNIQTVIANLLNIIEGKEQVLADLEIPVVTTPIDRMVKETTAKFLALNIKELKTILYDCMAVREVDIAKDLELKDAQQVASDASWRSEWDRANYEQNEGKYI